MKSTLVTVLYACVFLVFCAHLYVVEDGMRFRIDSLTTELDSLRVAQVGTLDAAWQESRTGVMHRRYGI